MFFTEEYPQRFVGYVTGTGQRVRWQMPNQGENQKDSGGVPAVDAKRDGQRVIRAPQQAAPRA